MRKTGRGTVLGWRWRRSALRRRGDAVEAWIVLATRTLATVCAVVAGIVVARGVDIAAERDRSGRLPVPAVVMETEPRAVRDARTGLAAYEPVRATVRWTDAEGTVRRGTTEVRTGTGRQRGAGLYGRTRPSGARPRLPGRRDCTSGAHRHRDGAGDRAVFLAAGRLARLRVERRSTE